MWPIPRWRDDPDYYARRNPLCAEHLAEIDRRARVEAAVAASAGDGSYAILLPRQKPPSGG